MAINEARIRKDLKSFDLITLFKEQLGWNTLRTVYPIVHVGDQAFTLQPIADKRGMVALLCQPHQIDGRLPEYSVRRKIEIEVTKLAREHIVIYVDLRRLPRYGNGRSAKKGARSRAGSTHGTPVRPVRP